MFGRFPVGDLELYVEVGLVLLSCLLAFAQPVLESLQTLFSWLNGVNGRLLLGLREVESRRCGHVNERLGDVRIEFGVFFTVCVQILNVC